MVLSLKLHGSNIILNYCISQLNQKFELMKRTKKHMGVRRVPKQGRSRERDEGELVVAESTTHAISLSPRLSEKSFVEISDEFREINDSRRWTRIANIARKFQVNLKKSNTQWL